MADNLLLNEGSGGSTLATAEVAFSGDTVDVQICGLGIVSGSAESYSVALVSAGAGAVGGGVQRMTLASDDPAVALLTTIDVDTGAMAVDLDAIETLITAGNADLASVKTAVELLDNAVSGAGYNITQFAGAAVPIGAGVEVTALRVTLATDSTGLLSVDDNDSSLTVDTTGTSGLEVVQVTAADLNMTEASASAIKDAVEIMDDWDESNRAKVNLIAGQAGIAGGEGVKGATVQRVTIATDDEVNNLLTTIDADTSKIPSLGTAVMAASAPTTIATDDTQFGSVGAAADMNGSLHGQLAYLGDNIDEVHVLVDQLSATASWAASTDATGIAQESDNVPSHATTTSLSIDKTGTSETEGSYGKTLGATINGTALSTNAVVSFYVRHASWTTIGAVFVRIGTDASNYMEYSIDPSDFSTSLWSNVVIALHEGLQTGTGLDLANIDYVAFGVTMGAAGNTTTNVFFNSLELHSVTSAELALTSDVTSPSVRVNKVGINANASVQTGAGAVSSGVQRVTIANDDTNLAAIAGTVVVLGTATYTETATKGNVVAAVRNDDLAPLADTDNEIGPLQTNSEGALYTTDVASETKRASGVAAGGTPGTDDIVAAVAARKIRILALGLFATSTTANNVFLDNADNDLLFNTANPLPLAIDADGDNVAGFVLPFNPGGWFETDTVNEAVTLNSSAAQDIAWTITYIEVP